MHKHADGGTPPIAWLTSPERAKGLPMRIS